ncbi:MAG TPA: hypothetical protein VIA07_04150 [Desulfuromonadales bacterium]
MKKFVMLRFICFHCDKRRMLAAAALVGSLLLSGCGMLPQSLIGQAPDLVLFQQGLDSLNGTTSPAAFSRLATEFPNSPWTSRAKAIEKALGRAKEEKRGNNQLQKKLEECQVEKERLASDVSSLEAYRKKLDDCRVEKDRLAGDLNSLEKYTLKLKSLLTEAGIAEPVPPSR